MLSKFKLEKDDDGYHDFGYNWWYNKLCPYAYQIFNTENIYLEDYYDKEHELSVHITEIINTVLSEANTFIDIEMVLEFGCGGGWFTKELLKHKELTVHAVDGSDHASQKMTDDQDLFNAYLGTKDFRKPIEFKEFYDLVICMEVAEHIEPPFAGTFVKSLAEAGKLIYFTFVEPGHHQNHIHHCNEQPFEYWVNIFRYFNYVPLRKLNHAHIARLNGYFFGRII